MKKSIFFKSIAIFILLLLFSTNTIYCNTNSESIKNTLNHYNILYNNYVSRTQCVVSIMRILGMTDSAADRICDRDIENPIFEDILGIKTEEGYIILAGEKELVSGYGYRYYRTFCPNRSVTLKECVAIMVRCLSENPGNLEESYKKAEEIGLISKDDIFYDKGDEFLEKENFHILLYRMINQKRCKYFEELVQYESKEINSEQVTYITYTYDIKTDQERVMTYSEYLDILQKN